MSYTKEMCLYLLDNPGNIEAESLTESVERQVFQAMKRPYPCVSATERRGAASTRL